jgi:hypothetical protein
VSDHEEFETGAPRAVGQVILERLAALTERAADAARAGDMTVVDALLLEREPLLERLAATLGDQPAEEEAVDPEQPIVELAQRELDTLVQLEGEILRARAAMLEQLAEVATAQAAVAAYVSQPAAGASAVDVRR